MRKRKSCRSYGEKNITSFLKSFNIEYVTEATFDKCRNAKNNLLRFDFFLPKHNILIEFQGQHHYEPVNKGRNAYRVFKTTALHDIIKDKFAEENGFKLITIPYWDISDIKNILLRHINIEEGE